MMDKTFKQCLDGYCNLRPSLNTPPAPVAKDEDKPDLCTWARMTVDEEIHKARQGKNRGALMPASVQELHGLANALKKISAELQQDSAYLQEQERRVRDFLKENK